MPEYLIVYVLTLSLCIAPEGKQACMEYESEYTFLNPYQCMTVRKDLIMLQEQYTRVIVNEGASKCEMDIIPYELYSDEEEARAVGEKWFKESKELYDRVQGE